MAEQKYHKHTSSHMHMKTTIHRKTILFSLEKGWNLPEKRQVGGVDSWYYQIPYPLVVGGPQTGA